MNCGTETSERPERPTNGKVYATAVGGMPGLCGKLLLLKILPHTSAAERGGIRLSLYCMLVPHWLASVLLEDTMQASGSELSPAVLHGCVPCILHYQFIRTGELFGHKGPMYITGS